MTYDYRAARDRIMGILRDGNGRPVAYVPSATPIRERMLLVALVEFAPDIRPALSTLGTMVGLGWREVHRLLRSMERKGLIRIESRPGQASRYHLTLTPVSPDTPAESGTPVGTDTPPLSTPTGVPLSTPTAEADNKADKEADKGCAPASGTPPLALEPPASKPNGKAGSNRKRGSRKASKAEPAETSEHRQVVAHYFQTFEASRGSKPAFNGADGKAVARLLKNVNGDVEKACAAITGAFVCWRNDTVSIRLIASDPSQFIGAKPRRTNQPERQNSGIDVFGESI